MIFRDYEGNTFGTGKKLENGESFLISATKRSQVIEGLEFSYDVFDDYGDKTTNITIKVTAANVQILPDLNDDGFVELKEMFFDTVLSKTKIWNVARRPEPYEFVLQSACPDDAVVVLSMNASPADPQNPRPILRTGSHSLIPDGIDGYVQTAQSPFAEKNGKTTVLVDASGTNSTAFIDYWVYDPYTINGKVLASDSVTINIIDLTMNEMWIPQGAPKAWDFTGVAPNNIFWGVYPENDMFMHNPVFYHTGKFLPTANLSTGTYKVMVQFYGVYNNGEILTKVENLHVVDLDIEEDVYAVRTDPTRTERVKVTCKIEEMNASDLKWQILPQPTNGARIHNAATGDMPGRGALTGQTDVWISGINNPSKYTLTAYHKDATNILDKAEINVIPFDIEQKPSLDVPVTAITAKFSLTSNSQTLGSTVTWTSDPPGINETGTSITFNPSTLAPGEYTVTARLNNYTNICDTTTLRIVKTAVTNIKFNHDTATSTKDAINMCKNYTTPYNISNGEWNSVSITNIPVCYTAGITPTIKARFTVEPLSVTNVTISASSIISNPILQNIVSTNIVFKNGVSVGDAQGYVSLTFAKSTPTAIRKSSDKWDWKTTKINQTSFTETIFTNSTHTSYNIFAVPVAPWNNTFNSRQNAWSDALDFTIVTNGCNGATTPHAALSSITQYLHSGHGLTYNTTNGAPRYAIVLSSGITGMRLSEYMSKSRGNMINCYDQAAAVQSLGNLLGVNVTYNYMRPFGYLNKVNVVGVGDCNNPFYNDHSYLPPTNRIPLINPPSGINTLLYPNISGFGNHAFAIFSGEVFDACSGPSLGKSVSLYLSETIDTSTTNKQNIAGSASNITVQNYNNLQ